MQYFIKLLSITLLFLAIKANAFYMVEKKDLTASQIESRTKSYKLSSSVDAFTDAKTIALVSSHSFENFDSFLKNIEHGTERLPEDSYGLRCDIDSAGNSNLLFTFDTGKIIKSTGSKVVVWIRVGKNKTLEYSGKMYSNSYTSGYVALNDDILLKQLESQETLKYRVKGSSDIVDRTFFSTGLMTRAKPVIEACK